MARILQTCVFERIPSDSNMPEIRQTTFLPYLRKKKFRQRNLLIHLCIRTKIEDRAFNFAMLHLAWSRENEGTERESQGVGRDMLCPRKLFLDERKSLF